MTDRTEEGAALLDVPVVIAAPDVISPPAISPPAISPPGDIVARTTRAVPPPPARLPRALKVSGYVAGATAPPATAYAADIVILAMDRVEETEAAIASALAQRGISRHIFVVDQGSHPDALERLAGLVEGRKEATLVSLRGNFGVAGGRNRGTALGHGRVIVGLDNDAVFDSPDTVAQAVAAFEEDERLAALGLRILVDATGDDDLSSWGYPRDLLPRAGDTFETVTFVGAGHAIRRAAWQQAGEYDEALFFCWEEFDFCLRAIAHGWRILYRGDLGVRHKVSPEQRCRWSSGRWFHFVRNRVYIERKRGTSWMALTPRIAGYILKGARNRLPGETLRAVAAAARMSAGLHPQPASEAVRDYIARNDGAYRGSLKRRLKTEVLSRLPGRA